jgi:hypothetical protein
MDRAEIVEPCGRGEIAPDDTWMAAFRSERLPDPDFSAPCATAPKGFLKASCVRPERPVAVAFGMLSAMKEGAAVRCVGCYV